MREGRGKNTTKNANNISTARALRDISKAAAAAAVAVAVATAANKKRNYCIGNKYSLPPSFAILRAEM